MRSRRILMCITMLIMFLGSNISVKGAENYRLLQIGTKDDRVVAYIEGNTNFEQAECQIGMVPCEEVQVGKMATGNFPYHTIILLDNSLSITEENKEKVTAVLTEYIQGKSETESITLATFGEDIQIQEERTKDVGLLLEALGNIQQNDQDTYLTDTLYHLLDTLEKEEYTRFIVISDGVDNKAIGITKEELTAKLSDNSHPIYTLGHVYKDNEKELENMFALSRITNGKEYLLDNLDDISEFVEEMRSVENIVCIEAAIPAELQDGSRQNILFTIGGEAEKNQVKAHADMPFSIKEAEEKVPVEKPVEEPVVVEEPEPVVTPAAEPEPEPMVPMEEETTAEQKAKDAEETGILTYVAAIVLIVAAVILLLKNKKGKGKAGEAADSKKNARKKGTVQEEISIPLSSDETMYLQDEDATILVDKRYLLILRDVKDSNRIFKYPLDGKVIIGRNTDKVNIAIDYSLTVSGQHCEIYVRNNGVYAKDLKSSNKTYLNGCMIEAETEIYSGSTLKLGEVEFSVEIIPI